MAKHKHINPDSVAQPRSAYSLACQAGRTVYLSAQNGIDRDGKTVVGGVEGQFRQAWRNIEAILKAVGGDLHSLVRVTIYVVGKENIAKVRAARKAIVEEGWAAVRPASTLLLVAGLVNDEWLVEIEATAVLD